MRVAIIGGGAAGMAAAFYLSKEKHEVVLFEKQEILGGNVRTLGKNVYSSEMPVDITIDNGVIEFLQSRSPFLTALFADLQVKTETIVGGSSGLFLENGKFFNMPGAIRRNYKGLKRVIQFVRLAVVMAGMLPIAWKLWRRKKGASLGDVLGTSTMSGWLRMLIMYSYSMPYAVLDKFPLDLAIHTFERGKVGATWMRVEGGVYSYFEAILDQSDIDVRTHCEDLKILRQANEVMVSSVVGTEHFDHVVIAIPPHEVLNLIEDPTQDEIAIFSQWKANYAETLIHTDTSIYEKWSPPEFTEFDLFEKNGGSDAGYNAYLNKLIGQPVTDPPHYFLAYNLEDRIDPRKVLHRQKHVTTSFHVDDNREKVRELSGANRTHFAGAYLFGGLHEGAIESASNAVGEVLTAGEI